jgi:hypothetical protein
MAILTILCLISFDRHLPITVISLVWMCAIPSKPFLVIFHPNDNARVGTFASTTIHDLLLPIPRRFEWLDQVFKLVSGGVLSGSFSCRATVYCFYGLRGACRGYEAMMTEKGADCWDIIMSANLPNHEHGASGWC